MKRVDVGHPGLPELFDPAGPNAPMAFAVLAGRVPGRALADDSVRPTTAVVQTREATAIFSRHASSSFVAAALATLRADSMVGVVWRGDWPPELTPSPAKQVQRVDFAPLAPSARGLAGAPPDWPRGVVAAPMTADLLERCEWRDTVTGAAGSTEQFLRTGLGACLLLGDEIVAEAYAPYIGPASAEVGVVTPERHRGQGYATLAVASLGAMLAARGLAMYWSCDADNDPSIRVAEKLGFVDRRPFTMALYRALATPP